MEAVRRLQVELAAVVGASQLHFDSRIAHRRSVREFLSAFWIPTPVSVFQARAARNRVAYGRTGGSRSRRGSPGNALRTSRIGPARIGLAGKRFQTIGGLLLSTYWLKATRAFM